MNFIEIKNFVKKFGAMLIMDRDRPVFVVLEYSKYQELENKPLDNKGTDTTTNNEIKAESIITNNEDQQVIDSLNREIQALNEEINSGVQVSTNTSEIIEI